MQAEAPDGEVVATGGKTIRQSFDDSREQSPLHVVSAWASSQSLVFAQLVTSDKSNEITASPDVLDALDLEGALVTIDAMRAQKDVAEQIREQGDDHLLSLKAKHKAAYKAFQAHFEDHCFGSGALKRGGESRRLFDKLDGSHGRVIRRRVFACSEGAEHETLKGQVGLQTVLAIENICSVDGEEGEKRNSDLANWHRPSVFVELHRKRGPEGLNS